MINLIKMFTIDEGLRQTSYKDTRGNTTVAIGFNMDNPAARGTWIKADIPESFNAVYNRLTPLSMQSCWKLLNACIDIAQVDLARLVPNYRHFPEYIQLALINLVFNLGATKLSKFTTFLSLVNQGKFLEASYDLSRTAWATQVPQRALRVCDLLKGDDSLYNRA